MIFEPASSLHVDPVSRPNAPLLRNSASSTVVVFADTGETNTCQCFHELCPTPSENCPYIGAPNVEMGTRMVSPAA